MRLWTGFWIAPDLFSSTLVCVDDYQYWRRKKSEMPMEKRMEQHMQMMQGMMMHMMERKSLEE